MISIRHDRTSGCHSLPQGLASLFLLSCISHMAVAQTITVKQDGTGDYTVIQDAVNATSDGDTVMVFPGIYYENVDITGKGIVLASTWLSVQNDSVIHQTIIDGNRQGSCVRSLSGSSWAQIIGFTLQNGTGTDIDPTHPEWYGAGGGFFLQNTSIVIKKCAIQNNFAWGGAGIFSITSLIKLYGNEVKKNWAVGPGGGIKSLNSSVIFDSIQLNSIFLNFGAWGSDIAISYNDSVDKIWLDTCTVLDPDGYYIGKFNDWAVLMELPIVSILNGKVEQLNLDLYVHPNGSDSNTGTSPNEPLKTISYALLKISSDSINPKTVHVSDGIYSHSLTGEHVPLQLKNYVNLIGQSWENSIIDCEDLYSGARFAYGQIFTSVKNISFINGNGYPTNHVGGISTGYCNKLILDSIALINTTGDFWAGIYSDSNDTLIIRNSLFKDCRGYQIVPPFNHFDQEPCYLEFTSNQFSYNKSDSSYDSKQISLAIGGSEFAPDHVYARIVNCLFNDNLDSTPWAPWPGPVAIGTLFNCNLDIVNCTFANNLTTNPWGGAVGASYSSDINFYNCILYGNNPYQVFLVNNTADQADTVRVYHSLVQNGQEGIMNYGVFNQVFWGDGNLDADPLFYGSGDHPYSIDYGSPCIDAGTLNLPPGITLPEYDIAGNPRIYGETIDMGAYEYGPWVGTPEVPGSKFKVQSSKLLSVSPNPFSYGTYISYEISEKGMLNISVYNASGLKVRTLINTPASVGDEGSFYWDGAGQEGNDLPAGTYIVRMTIEGKLLQSMKIVKY